MLGSIDCLARRRLVNTRRLTALIEHDGNGYLALCPEFDVASQGDTVEEGQSNLRDALALFFQEASSTEIRERLRPEVYVTSIDVPVG